MLMKIGKSSHSCGDFKLEMKEKGFAIFSIRKNKKTGYYPNKFPDFEEIDINKLSDGDRITFRAFFQIGENKSCRIDSGLIDAEIELIEEDTIWADIQTELPVQFPLQKGTTLELTIDEIIGFPPAG